MEILHHSACCANVLLRHATVAFGDVPHDLESGVEEPLTDLLRCIRHRRRLRRALLLRERVTVFDVMERLRSRLGGRGGLGSRARLAGRRFAPGGSVALTSGDLVVDEVTRQHAECGTDRATDQHADSTADEFPAPLHAAILPIPGEGPATRREPSACNRLP